MSIELLSINVDGTLAATGGTATTMISKGDTENKHQVIIDDSSEYIDQTTVLFSNVDPKVNSGAPNGFTQARRSFVVHDPLGLDNGNRTTNSVKVEFSFDPETTVAEIDTLRGKAAQMIFASALDAFYHNGSMG